MNLLLIPANYPYPASTHTGAQNERCARALGCFADRVVVVSPRPFMPSFLAFRPRWQSYAAIPYYRVCRGIEIYRPAYFMVPWLMQSVWRNAGAYYALRPLVRRLHRKHRFDAILSFDLSAVGGLVWRLGQELGIPAAGWATGGDMRNGKNSPFDWMVAEALEKLDMVFYQSSELLNLSGQILSAMPEQLLRSGHHRILSRGVMGPETLPSGKERAEVRATLHVAEDEVMILYLGRIVFEKGLFGLVDIVASNSPQIGNWKLVLVGGQPAFDQTEDLKRYLRQYPQLRERVHVLHACAPQEIWRYFNAADIFVFPSFEEGMPNALLEAMITGLPAVAFDIPALQDIVRYDHEALFTVEAFNYERLFEVLILLSRDPQLRQSTGDRGKKVVQQHFSLIENMKSAISCLENMKRDFSSKSACPS